MYFSKGPINLSNQKITGSDAYCISRYMLMDYLVNRNYRSIEIFLGQLDYFEFEEEKHKSLLMDFIDHTDSDIFVTHLIDEINDAYFKDYIRTLSGKAEQVVSTDLPKDLATKKCIRLLILSRKGQGYLYVPVIELETTTVDPYCINPLLDLMVSNEFSQSLL